MNHALCRFGIAGILSLAALSPAIAQNVAVQDTGSFKVYQHDRALGVESFSFEIRGDSITVFAQAIQTIPTSMGDEKLEKNMILIANAIDYDLRVYQSNQKFGDKELVRGVTVGDTLFTSFREVDGAGEADRRLRPPGKLFVLDAQIFTLFDVICRNLHGKSFDRRPVMVFVMGARDSVIETTATDMGSETIRWGARPVVARKLSFADQRSQFIAWVSPNGHMLRLHQPKSGLRVERDPPPVKRRAARSGG